MRHIPAIDGLRAVAIGSVIAFHLEWPGAALGWAGVPLFFVISGFLITSILLSQKEEARGFGAYYANFVRRRALRIFPLYYAYLAGSIVLGAVVGQTLSSGWSYWIYLQNYTLGASRFSGSFTMGHTWSLAVEEQFYLLWPLIVWLCSRRALIAVCGILIALGPVSRMLILEGTGNPFLAFTPLSSSADLLAMGALLGLAHRAGRLPGKRHCLTGLALSAAAIAFAAPYSSYWTPTGYLMLTFGPLVFTTLGIGSVALIGLVVNDGWLARAARNRVAMYVGKISYGLYIYHGLFLVGTARIKGMLPGVFGQIAWSVLVIGLSVIAAHLSYHLFEKRFLALKDRKSAMPKPAEASPV
ncbi:O-acetyltransferase OatA [compost metagenome]